MYNYNKKISFVFDCSSRECLPILEKAIKADGKKIRTLIKKQIPDLYNALGLNFKNPFEKQSKKTKEYFIYCWSGVEYFLKIEG